MPVLSSAGFGEPGLIQVGELFGCPVFVAPATLELMDQFVAGEEDFGLSLKMHSCNEKDGSKNLLILSGDVGLLLPAMKLGDWSF